MTNIPFLSFDKTNELIATEIKKAFGDFFDSKQYILGEKVSQFEREYALYSRVKYCIGVSNGLDALHLSLKALGIGEKDEVIVPSNTFIATVLAITYVGATPVFVEPDISTYNINPVLIEQKVTSNTKAIMPVHLYGQACEMDSLLSITKKYNLYLIEDNAQAQGATWKGKKTGSFGHINSVSFYPGKNLGALGDAGAITTDDYDLKDKIRTLRNYGSNKKYYNDLIGFNNRLDECQAAFLSIKLKYLDEWNQERRQIAHWYNNLLEEVSEIILPKIKKGATSVYHLYVIRVKKRTKLQNFLKEKGIGTLIHYPIPPHLQKCYLKYRYKVTDFPIAEELSKCVLSLPIYPGLAYKQVSYITECVKSFYRGSI